jgi:hypothetical protein
MVLVMSLAFCDIEEFSVWSWCCLSAVLAELVVVFADCTPTAPTPHGVGLSHLLAAKHVLRLVRALILIVTASAYRVFPLYIALLTPAFNPVVTKKT